MESFNAQGVSRRDGYELFGQFEIEEDEMTSEEWLWVQGNPGHVGSWKAMLPIATLYTPCCQKWVNLTGPPSPGIGGGQLGLLITIPCEMVIPVKLTPHITIFVHGKNI